jgi:hypothetical protein
VGCLNGLGRDVALGGQFTICAVPNGLPSVLQQPGKRDPVFRRQFQNRSLGTGGLRRAAAKIAGVGYGGKGTGESSTCPRLALFSGLSEF